MSELRQRRPVVQRRRIQTAKEREREKVARLNFKSEVMRLDQYRCIGSTSFGSNHRCEGPIECHHAIRQQTLRAHISPLGLDEKGINDWLWTPDIGISLCRSLHEAHSSRTDPIPYEWLPARVIDFALGREIRHLLLREHPPLFPERV